MRNDVVYVIGTPGSGMAKIGRSTNVTKRLSDIRNMSPVPLQILWTHPGGAYLETRLHWHFSEIRSHGEWFQFEGDPVAAVEAAMANRPWERSARTPTPAGTPDPSTRLTEALAALSAHLGASMRDAYRIKDPDERAAAVRAHERQVLDIRSQLARVGQESVLNLKEGRSWRQVGNMLGMTGSRAEQISRASR
ncbi:GIY-YIG nuclease family protein [Streptomyces sp. W4I9-2]|uniref:GIY-YIG nuclease family protein n=1 Tax=Streptomyces sp. W4I9-2 TaxID=3042297 RepID=UPI00277DFA82|nr:GIY-YIG nuclease family protein [Streptomyces sp. W4I9-2]MDQ0694256.1 hypothetical protein [Streptomyces sp. W4I9-2]